MADTPDGLLRVGVLGPVQAVVGAHVVSVGSPRQQAVLAVLAARANTSVSRDMLVDALWGADHPASAAGSIHTYISGLRSVLEPDRNAHAPARFLTTSGHGYLLRLEPGGLDVGSFETQLARARRLAVDGDLGAAEAAFESAFGLWRGEAYAGVPGPFAELERARLGELRIAALEDHARLVLRAGRTADAVAMLFELVREDPLREQVRGQLMLALHRAGRRAEALEQFREAREILVGELGVEPGSELQDIHLRVLNDDLESAPAAQAAVVVAPVAPAQLPPDTYGFTGRQGELDRLHDLLAEDQPARPVVITATAGMGKTALAVRLAHQVAERFADGQLYLDLRGFAPQQSPAGTAEALTHLLAGLGVDPANAPAGQEEQVGKYRSLLAGKRVLIVLDNAVSSDQVRPLLPGSPACAVVITSRNRLTGLVARDGAELLTLDALPRTEAIDLLTRQIGAARAAAEAEAVRRLADLCGHLPLALRIAAARIATEAYLSITGLIDELVTGSNRLEALALEGDEAASIGTVFSWSYLALKPEPARLFRLLGLHPGPDISLAAAAALGGGDVPTTRRLLATLVSANLLTQPSGDRYQLHDLLRLYATQLAADETVETRDAALVRVLGWYLNGVYAADQVLNPLTPSLPDVPSSAAGGRLEFASYGDALAWCEAERINLVEAIRQAAGTGHHSVAVAITRALWVYFDISKHWSDWFGTHEIALGAARVDQDRNGEAFLLNSLGTAYRDLERFDRALENYQAAWAIRVELGDRPGQLKTLLNLDTVYSSLDRLEEALEHAMRARAIGLELADPRSDAVTLAHLGEIYRQLGRLEEAIDHLRPAVDILGELGEQRGFAINLHNLGISHFLSGSYDEGFECVQKSLATFVDLRDRSGEALCCESLGEANLRLGQLDESARCLRRAFELYDELGDPAAARVSEDLAAVEARRSNAG